VRRSTSVDEAFRSPYRAIYGDHRWKLSTYGAVAICGLGFIAFYAGRGRGCRRRPQTHTITAMSWNGLRSLALVVALLVGAPVAHAARTLYVPNSTSGGLSEFAVGVGSALTPLAGSPLAASGPEAAVLTPDGRFLFLTQNSANTIGRFAVAADGSLTSLGSVAGTGSTGAMSGPRGMAISPDGTKVYAIANNGLFTFAVGSDGSLTNVGGQAAINTTIGVDLVATPDGRDLYAVGVNGAPTDIIGHMPLDANGLPAAGAATPVATAPDSLQRLALTPDGRFLYTASSAPGATGVRGYAVNGNGTLTEVPGSPFAAGGSTFTLATSPAAPVLIAGEVDTDTVRGFTIGAGGALTPVGSPVPAGGDPLSAVITPDGRSAFVGIATSDGVARLTIAGDGSVSSAGAVTTAPAGVGIGPVVSPDQGPTAALAALGTALPGAATRLDASASTDPDGTVARFDWDFGDGTTLADGGPTPAHVYAAAGAYTARVTVTDDEGCSTKTTSTGRSASCAASARASTTTTVTVAEAPAPQAPALPAPASPTPRPTPKPTCASRRTFTAKDLKLKSGESITKAKILYGKKSTRTLKPGKRSVDVKLTGLPKGTFKLKITIKKKGHKPRTLTRTYRTCQPKPRA